MGLPLCAISSNLKVVDRPDDTEEILDGLAREFFPLPRLNQTPHDRIGDFLERSVLQMGKDVLVQLARHAALRRTFLIDDEVMIFPSTSRQTKSHDWRLGAAKMTFVVNALPLNEFRQPSFGFRARELVDVSDYHCTSDPFVLARYIDPIAADVLRAFDIYRTTLSGSARH